jgi:hypothetical protein
MSQLQVTGEAKIRDIQGPVVANSGVITALDGAASQYVRGDGTLADFPTSTGGGSSVSYYLNSSVSQGTIGGVAYRQLGKTPIAGAGTDITTSTNGYVASYLTDANDPALLEVPAGNFNCEFYFSVNSDAHNPFVYAEVYKYDGTTFTLIGSSQSVPEYLTNGTTLSPYYFAIPVAQTVLAITDRIAIRIYVNVDGRTVTLHTENNHLCQVVTTFSKGLTSLNNLTRQVQFLATGTSGTDFNISSATATHTFNIPSASETNRGLVTIASQSFAGIKTFNDAIKGEVGVLLKNGVISSSNGYTALNAFENTLIITSLISGTPFSNNLEFAPSTSNTYTFPDASGTLALLEGTQTFSGAKTFSLDILVNGLTVGRGAGSVSTNTVLGTTALSSNTTGASNVAIGINSLNTNTTGGSNVAVGQSSLQTNNGNQNTAIGNQALQFNTTGVSNTAIGHTALQNNTTGNNNIAIGYESGISITTGSNNTIIGKYAGTAALANNIVLADGAGNIRYQWNGTNNVFGNPISGTSATFSGSMFVNSPLNNTVITTSDATNITNGFNLLGSSSYWGIRTATSGNFNLDVFGAGVPKNALTIAQSSGAATFSSSVSGTSIRSSAVGSFGFNTANNGEFQIYGTATDGMLIAGRGSTNDLVLLNKNGSDVLRVPTGTTTVSLQSLTGSGSRAVLADASGNLSAPVSDISVKENIKPIGYGLNEVLKMNPVWFDFIDEYKNYGQGRQNGNIAQEMEAIIPEAVFITPSTGKMGINYDQLHAVYIKAIQELEARIKQLENK